ncbi:MAG: hypothetical protein IPK32_05000 [Verrucomicrobiaceae bacterium]|nr:hypothetical protein [Verrucomicrobiaceae bacterium]
MSILIYNLLLPLGLLIMLPGAFVKMWRRGGKWSDLAQRLGFYPQALRISLERLPARRLWMHAVSVGEVNVARKLIARLLSLAPDCGIVLSTTTPTGYALAKECESKHPDRVVAIYSPVDLPGVPSRVLEALRPRQLVLVEAEVWPNLLHACSRQKIPVSLINARLSPRSERRLTMLRGLVAPIYARLSRVCVQELKDVDRWAALGVLRDRITHTGSVKYDPQGASVPPDRVAEMRRVLTERGVAPEQPVLLAASTHAGEEVELARVFQKLQQSHADLALLLVPRHAERRAEITAELKKAGLHPALRSDAATRVDSASRCVLIDSTGELAAWMHLATLVVIGKSFLAEGGQNPAEAVMAGKPVLFGPHMENFTPLVEMLLSHKGAVQVHDFRELEMQAAALLAKPAEAEALATRGQAALLAHDGATDRTATILLAM